MRSFERNSTGKGLMVFFLAVNTLCLLYCVHLLMEFRGTVFFIGLLILLTWIAFVFADEVKALRYHRQMVFILPEGVTIGSKKHSRRILWEEIQEVSVRYAHNAGSNYFANDWLVLSTQPLSDSARGALCSDLSPWLPKMDLAEFRLSALSADPNIGDPNLVEFLKAKCPLFRAALEQYHSRSLIYATADGVVSLNQKQYDKLTSSVSGYTGLMVLREFIWFGAVLITMWELSDMSNVVFSQGLIFMLWVLALLLAGGCLLSRRIVLKRIRMEKATHC